MKLVYEEEEKCRHLQRRVINFMEEKENIVHLYNIIMGYLAS